jgi:hypothetical protein
MRANGFEPGIFEQVSVQELKDRVAAVHPCSRSCSFNVVVSYVSPNTDIKREYIDIGALQAYPPNKGALFQVASRFHALESWCNRTLYRIPDVNTVRESRYFLSSIYSGVQGEMAASSAAPGAIYRMYCFKDEINLLGDIGISLNNIGMPDETEPNRQQVCVLAGDEQLGDRVRIGIQKGVRVTNGLTNVCGGECHVRCDNHERLINQAFVSTFNLNKKDRRFWGNQHDIERQLHTVSQRILTADYAGTIYAGAFVQSPRIFLTCVGGGVFFNNPDWIASAITSTRDFIREKGLHVTLTFFKDDRWSAWDGANVAGKPAFDNFMDRMRDLSHDLGGYVVEFDKPGSLGAQDEVSCYPGNGVAAQAKNVSDWDTFYKGTGEGTMPTCESVSHSGGHGSGGPSPARTSEVLSERGTGRAIPHPRITTPQVLSSGSSLDVLVNLLRVASVNARLLCQKIVMLGH